MMKLLDRGLALIGLQRVAKPVASVDKDKLIAAMYRRYGDDLGVLKEKWQAEFAAGGPEDSGCGHGLVRFAYDRESTPCHCSGAPRELILPGGAP